MVRTVSVFTNVQVLSLGIMVGLIERVTTGTSPLRLGHHSCFTMS